MLPLIYHDGYDLNIGRYIKTTNDDQTDLPAALAAYQAAREARIASETALFERLAAAGISELGATDE